MAFRDALSLKRPLTMLYRMFFIILYSNKNLQSPIFLQEFVMIAKGGLIYLTLFLLDWEIHYDGS